MRDLAKGEGTGFNVIDLDAPAQPFPERFDGRSARVRAFLLYLALLRPRATRSPTDLNPGRLLSARGTRAVGYVSSNSGQLEGLISSPANRMFVDFGQVGQAFVGLTSLKDDELNVLLPTHGFAPDSVSLIRSDDRVGLIRARLDTLISGERAFMEERNVTLPAERTGTSIADSDVSDEE